MKAGDDKRKGGFLMLPNLFVDNWLATLSPVAVVVWLYGWRQSFGWRKSSGWTTEPVTLPVTKIMSATGLSNKTVLKALQELRSHQLLERTGFVKRAAQYRWKVYTSGESTSVEKLHHTGEDSTPISVEELHRPYKEVKKERNSTKETLNGCSPPFLDWYQSYPRKVAKRDAEKAYRRLTATERKLLATNTPAWTEEFATRPSDKIPYPATFISRGAWEEPPPPTTGPRVRSGAEEILEALRG